MHDLVIPNALLIDGTYGLEEGVPEAVAQELTGRGHQVKRVDAPWGGGQMIRIDKSGFLVGGSDARKDGMALGY